MDGISAFIINTCRIKPQPNVYRVDAWLSNMTHTEKIAVGYAEEIYIDSMFPDGPDVPGHRYRKNSHVAVSSSDRIPSLLPLTFDDTIHVCEIISSQSPGYVRLRSVGQLRKLPSEDKFTFQPIAHGADLYLYSYITRPVTSSVSRLHAFEQILYPCLEWPAQAAEWPTRRRRFGWPDDTTIRHVVDNGCDLVHRCRHYCDQEDESPIQTLTFTFPVAETILLNTWTPAQQIVYHVLRVIVKQEFSQYVCTSGYSILSVHHLKTLMLWMSERNSKDYWTRSTVVETCASAMQVLTQLYDQQCLRGYFLREVNIIECSKVSLWPPDTIASHLKRFTDIGYLTDWMIRNYVSQCIEKCPKNVKALFGDVRAIDKVKQALSMAGDWRVSMTVHDSFTGVQRIVQLTPPAVDEARYYWNLNAVVRWRKDLYDIDQRFDGYFTAVICLANVTIVKLNTSSSIPDAVCDMVAAMVTSIDKSNKMSVVQKSNRFFLKKAVYLLRVYSRTSCAITGSILLLLIRLYLKRAQRFSPKTADSKSVCRLADVYLAIVYCAAGRYRAAERHCRRALANSNGQNASDVVEGQNLHSIDPRMNAISGLVVLYTFIRNATLDRPREDTRSDVFSAELFVYYLRFVVRFASGRKSVTSYVFRLYKKHLRRTQSLSCGDCLLFYYVSKNKGISGFHCKETEVCALKNFLASDLCQLITDFSIEQLTALQLALVRDYPPNYAVVVTDIKAMNAYRREFYGLCYQLSLQNVFSLFQTDSYYRFPINGCMTHLTDDDLASFTGVVLLLVSPAPFYDRTITQMTLSLYSLVQSLLKINTSGMSTRTLVLLYIYTVHQLYIDDGTVGIADESLLEFVYRKAITRMRRAVVGL